jgi:hypothetical protein
MKSKSNAKQIKEKQQALGEAGYASFISTYSNEMECKLPGIFACSYYYYS